MESGRAWLARLWLRGEVRAALRVASPVLSRQIDAVLGGGRIDARQVRRVIVSTSSYLLRWQRRATPFGLFAGVAAASVGDEPTVWFGRSHRMVVRADAQWLSGLIDGLEQDPGLLPRLPVVVNSAGFVRGDRFVVPIRSSDAQPGQQASLEFSVRHTRPVRCPTPPTRRLTMCLPWMLSWTVGSPCLKPCCAKPRLPPRCCCV